MIDKFFSSLGTGDMVPVAQIRAWLSLAIVKKHGVLKQPYLCRTSDAKINPPGRDLYCAAALVDDPQILAEVETILLAEEQEVALARNRSVRTLNEMREEFLGELLERLEGKQLQNLQVRIKELLEMRPTP